MRIAQLIRILVAILYLSLLAIPSTCQFQNSSFTQQHHHHRHHPRTSARHSRNHTWLQEFGRWLSPPEAQLLLRQESYMIEGSTGGVRETMVPVECCPSVVEMIQPEGATNINGIYVELYKDGTIRQRFYEVSCRPEVLKKPCRFLDKKLHSQSECVQTFSYTYALVKETPELLRHYHENPPNQPGYFPKIPGKDSNDTTWMMDYIQVRSGCSCVVFPKSKPKETKTKKTQRNRPTRRPHRHTTVMDDSEVILQT